MIKKHLRTSKRLALLTIIGICLEASAVLLLAQEPDRLEELRQKVAAVDAGGKYVIWVLECRGTDGPVSVVYKDGSGQLWSIEGGERRPVDGAESPFNLLKMADPGEGVAVLVSHQSIVTNSAEKELYDLLPELGRALSFEPMESTLYFPPPPSSDLPIPSGTDSRLAFRRLLGSCVMPAAAALSGIGSADEALRRKAAVALTIAGDWPPSALTLLVRSEEARSSAIEALESLRQIGAPDLRTQAITVLEAIRAQELHILRSGNLRVGPSLESEVTGSVSGDLEVRRLREEGEWLNVRLPDGTEGWIHSLLLRGEPSSSPSQEGARTPLSELWRSFVSRERGEYCFGNESKSFDPNHWGVLRFLVATDSLMIRYSGVVQYANGTQILFKEDFSGDWQEEGVRGLAKSGSVYDFTLGDRGVTWEHFATKESLTFTLDACKSSESP